MRVVNKTALVFGGTGYLGSHVVHQLYKKGFEITLIEHPTLYNHLNLKGLNDLCDGRLKLRIIDWSDEATLDHLMSTSHEFGVAIFGGCQYFEDKIGESKLIANHFHLNAALTVFSILEKQLNLPVILLSSYKVYGQSAKPFLKEDFKLLKGKINKIELNALTERFLLLLKNKTIIARLSIPIGVDESLKIGPSSRFSTSDFHKKIFDSIYNGKSFPINYRAIKGMRHFKSMDFIHAVDAGDAIAVIADKALKQIENQNLVYNVSSNQAFPENKFAKALKFFSQRKFLIQLQEMGANENLIVQLSNNKIIAELDWYNKYPLIDAIKSHANYLSGFLKDSCKAA